MTTLLRTPLYDVHRALGAKMVPFAGWEMPVQYPTGILAEHRAVRDSAGIFDVCHMGEFEVTGPDRNAFVNRVTCNDVAALEPGQVQYSAFLNESGGIVDDCTVYRFEDKVMLVVNAANIEKDWEYLVGHKASGNLRLRNLSQDVGLLAIQGPRAEALLQRHSQYPLATIRYYHFGIGDVAGCGCFISRTGYTGEDGFELFFEKGQARRVWDALVATGASLDLAPIGLGARDTLRLEAGMPLYGQEISPQIHPLEADLAFGLDLSKTDTVGIPPLAALRAAGFPRRAVSLVSDARRVAHTGTRLFRDGRDVGEVTSGSFSPTLDKSIARGLVVADASATGTSLEAEIRGKRYPMAVVPSPFYKRER
jgi:aminomethyltransferase